MKIKTGVIFTIFLAVFSATLAQAENFEIENAGDILLKNGKQLHVNGDCTVERSQKIRLGLFKQYYLNFCGNKIRISKESFEIFDNKSFFPHLRETLVIDSQDVVGKIYVEELDATIYRGYPETRTVPAELKCVETIEGGDKTTRCTQTAAITYAIQSWSSSIDVRFIYFAPGSKVGTLIGFDTLIRIGESSAE